MKKIIIIVIFMLVLFLGFKSQSAAEVDVNYTSLPHCIYYFIAFGKIQKIDLCDYLVTASMELQRGWNMIALPVAMGDNPEFIPNIPFVYEQIENSRFVPDFKCGYEWHLNGYKRIKTNEVDECVRGYWAYVEEKQTNRVNGWKFSQAEKEFTAGWHMIGGCSELTKITPLQGRIRVIYKWRNNGFSRVYDSTLKPGNGYWMLYDNNGPGMIKFENVF